MKLGFEDFTAEDCEVQEQCILAPGHRLLLRFDDVIQNLGLGDYGNNSALVQVSLL